MADKDLQVNGAVAEVADLLALAQFKLKRLKEGLDLRPYTAGAAVRRLEGQTGQLVKGARALSKDWKNGWKKVA